MIEVHCNSKNGILYQTRFFKHSSMPSTTSYFMTI